MLGALFGEQQQSLNNHFSCGAKPYQGPRSCTMHEAPIYFVYPARHTQLCKQLAEAIQNEDSTGTVHPYRNMLPFPSNILLKFMTSNDEVLRQEVIGQERGFDGKMYSSHSIVALRKGHVHSVVMGSPNPALTPKGAVATSYTQWEQRYVIETKSQSTRFCNFYIAKSTTFTIVTKVTEDVLSRADKIVLSYIK